MARGLPGGHRWDGGGHGLLRQRLGLRRKWGHFVAWEKYNVTAEDTYRLNGLDVARPRPLPRALGLGHPLCEDGVARLRGGRVAVGNLRRSLCRIYPGATG